MERRVHAHGRELSIEPVKEQSFPGRVLARRHHGPQSSLPVAPMGRHSRARGARWPRTRQPRLHPCRANDPRVGRGVFPAGRRPPSPVSHELVCAESLWKHTPLEITPTFAEEWPPSACDLGPGCFLDGGCSSGGEKVALCLFWRAAGRCCGEYHIRRITRKKWDADSSRTVSYCAGRSSFGRTTGRRLCIRRRYGPSEHHQSSAAASNECIGGQVVCHAHESFAMAPVPEGARTRASFAGQAAYPSWGSPFLLCPTVSRCVECHTIVETVPPWSSWSSHGRRHRRNDCVLVSRSCVGGFPGERSAARCSLAREVLWPRAAWRLFANWRRRRHRRLRPFGWLR